MTGYLLVRLAWPTSGHGAQRRMGTTDEHGWTLNTLRAWRAWREIFLRFRAMEPGQFQSCQ